MSSMAGGCEVMFYGQGMAMDPSMISVVFQSDGFGNIDMGSPDPCKCGTILFNNNNLDLRSDSLIL